jgi:RNA polymerase sigma factor (TIGR02999 family)
MEENPVGDLLAALMAELRAMARSLLAHKGNAQSLQPTDLIDTAIRRLLSSGFDWEKVDWENRRYFFGAAYRAMGRALHDHARARKAGRRLPPNQRLHLEQIHLQNLAVTANKQPEVIEALLETLERMEARHPEWAELTKHRYYSGYEVDEAAKAMGISPRTAGRYWERARAYLHHEILRIVNEDGPAPREDSD